MVYNRNVFFFKEFMQVLEMNAIKDLVLVDIISTEDL